MDFLKSLYHAHIFHIARTNGWITDGEGVPDYRAWLRAEIYLRLDLLIAELHQSLPVYHGGPDGRAAVSYLVSSRTGCSPSEASQLSFSEALFALHSDLEAVNIPEEVLAYPPHIQDALLSMQSNQHVQLPPCSEAEWDHSYLKKYQEMYKQR
ncbi:hypothetical protein OOO72_003277 [Salmonella enterica]|nr:hypothetical protein [Salmonella enterica subsp. enterica serovar Panama]EKB5298817.1 hypothetical protein [Salmonella enterica]EKB5506498.1 hypothetical protein [Salmonella enterica]EKC2470759.1 hypothetical protein [Salmonella enterica]EKC2485125.1 hypothetical protein [Salmonella enterica]